MPQSPRSRFALQMRARRREIRMTQGELARRLSETGAASVDATVITRIEKGVRDVRLDEAVYIAQILCVPLSALVSEADPLDVRLADLRGALDRQRDLERAAEAELRRCLAASARIQHEIDQLERQRRGGGTQ